MTLLQRLRPFFSQYLLVVASLIIVTAIDAGIHFLASENWPTNLWYIFAPRILYFVAGVWVCVLCIPKNEEIEVGVGNTDEMAPPRRLPRRPF